MKFMKLGSKPDLFQSNGENVRYVATDLATDIIINVGDFKFHLHKFPLLSKSARLQKVVAISDENSEEIQINDIPGGPAAFEICAKFCYGMTVTLNAYNVVLARCAAEYLEMYETIDKGNLIYKIEVFLNSSIFKTWKDSIIVFQTTKCLLPWSEELKVVSHCLDSIASKASIDTSKVEWSYTYNRKKLPSENGNESPLYNGVKKQLMVPKDWWVEDLCDLPIDLYKRVITTIKTKGKVGSDVIGESLKAYVERKLPWLGKEGGMKRGDDVKSRFLIETIIGLLPTGKNGVFCSFLIRLLQASVLLDCPEIQKKELMRKIGQQLQNASVADIVILDVDIVQELVKIFMMQYQTVGHDQEHEFLEVKCVDSASEVKVANLVDCYLAEIAKNPDLPFAKFAHLAETVSTFSRSSHDGIYRAIDMYLKEHPDISKSERKRICRLMDCRKLSADACMHAVQNERLPLRVVVQVLFFEQIRATTAGGGVPVGSHESSRSATTNTEEEWDSMPTSQELKALKGELAALRLKDVGNNNGGKMPNNINNKAKNMVISRRMFLKMFSGKDRESDNGSSDTSESRCSTNAEETKSSTPSRSRRQSLS